MSRRCEGGPGWPAGRRADAGTTTASSASSGHRDGGRAASECAALRGHPAAPNRRARALPAMRGRVPCHAIGHMDYRTNTTERTRARMSQRDESAVIPDVLPLIPLRDLILFPNLVVPLFVGRERRSRRSRRPCARTTSSRSSRSGRPRRRTRSRTTSTRSAASPSVMQELKLPDGTAKALVEGQQRFRDRRVRRRPSPYFKVRVELIEEAAEVDVETEALMRSLVARLREGRRAGQADPAGGPHRRHRRSRSRAVSPTSSRSI